MKKTITQKGITLIALIITIIILLILAVVTIGSIKNSNIISYAENASDNYESSKKDEQDILSKYEDLISVGVYKQTGPLGEARNIENYGKKVIGFQSKGEGLEEIEWRVFYQDDKNVYLISERVDSEGEKYYPLESPSFYKVVRILDDEGNVQGQTQEKTSTLEKYNSGADVSKQGQDLMQEAKVANMFTEENINKNIIVTAYMCDIEVWEGYTDEEGKAVWAMGGPTIELYEKSFNSVKEESIITSNIIEGLGYDTSTLANDTIKETDKNGIYRLEGNVGQHRYTSWYLSSPYFNNTMNGVYNTAGKLNNLAIVNTSEDGGVGSFGMRPIVCIPLDNFDYELE